jgi:ABC-type amino acid transport substrate-binding protein
MKQILISVLVSFLTVLVFHQIIGGNGGSSPAFSIQKESAFDRVIRTGTIRCGYIIYPPQMSIDLNTHQLSGFAYDLMERVGKDLHLKIEWTEEISPSTWMEGLHQNRFDVFCNPGWATSARALQVLATSPVFYTAVNAYGRKDDHRFDDISNLNDETYKIATIDGSTSAAIARDIFPKAKTVSLPDMTDFSQLLLEVSTGKADVTFSEVAQFVEFQQKNSKSNLRNLTPDRPVRLVQNAMMVDGSEGRLVTTLSLALQNLHNDGFINQLLDKYQNAPGVWRRVPQAWQ